MKLQRYFGKKSPKNADILFWNRQSFLRFNQFRINQTLKTLSKKHRLVFLTLPRLLHVNQEGLPGYFDPNVPSGIHNFDLDRQSQLAVETLFPDLITRRIENFFPIVHSMLVMGSVGSIAQTEKSQGFYRHPVTVAFKLAFSTHIRGHGRFQLGLYCVKIFGKNIGSGRTAQQGNGQDGKALFHGFSC